MENKKRFRGWELVLAAIVLGALVAWMVSDDKVVGMPYQEPPAVTPAP